MERFKSLIISLTLLLTCTLAFGQEVTIESGYKGWGWEKVYLAKNEYTSISVVPEAAGRILEHNLGTAPSLWLNPDMLGQSFPTTELVKPAEWRNYGGFRLVLLPNTDIAVNVDGSRSKRWPPPAMLGDNEYEVVIGADDQGHQTIDVTSGIQELPVPKWDNKTKAFPVIDTPDELIQYKRSLYIEAKTSRVHITHTLINKGTNTIERGMMTTSQHLSRSAPDLTDGENYLAYIPFDEKNKLADGHAYGPTATADSRWNWVNRNRMPLDKNNPEHMELYYNSGTNWTGEVAPGVMELHYDYDLMSGYHIIASKPWIAFVNKTNLTAFVKLIEPLDPTKKYENNQNVSIYNSALSTGYLETEVMTPLYTLAANESATYKEIHCAAQLESLPILDANQQGVITKRLAFVGDNLSFAGSYGVFRSGVAILRLENAAGEKIKDIELGEVNPLVAFVFDATQDVPAETKSAQLLIRNAGDEEYVLDTLADITVPKGALGVSSRSDHVDIKVFPNPTTGIVKLEHAYQQLSYSIANIDGKTVKAKTRVANDTIDMTDLKAGFYMVKIHNGDKQMVKKVLKK